MPLGHSSFEGLRRRRLRPSRAAWGLAVGGAGILGSSAVLSDPYDVVGLGLLSAVTGFAAWREGKRIGLAAAALSGLAFLALVLWHANLDSIAALRAAPGMLGLLALSVGLAEMGYLAAGLVQTAVLDQVTHLPNYQLFMRFLEIEASRSMRYRLPFCLVVLEIQDLESYSRMYGYWRTDTMLRELAKTMADTLRRSDVLGRLGGPQFGLILPMTRSDGALVALQRLESAVRVLPLPTNRGAKPKPIAWKAGIAEFPTDGEYALDLLRAATERVEIRTQDRPMLPRP